MVKNRFFHSLFYSEKNGVPKKRVFLRCSKGYKNSCVDGEKRACPQRCLSDKKKCFNGVSRVEKSMFQI